MPHKFLWKYLQNVDSLKVNGLRGEGSDAKSLKTVRPEMKDRSCDRMENSSVDDQLCQCSSHSGQLSNQRAASILTFGIPQPVASPFKSIIRETASPVVASRKCHLLQSGPVEKMDDNVNFNVPQGIASAAGILDDKKEAEKRKNILNVKSTEFFKYFPVFDHEGDPRLRKYTQSFQNDPNVQLDNEIPLKAVADNNLICNERKSIFDSLTQGIKRKIPAEEEAFVKGDGVEDGREQSTAQGKSSVCPPSFSDFFSRKSQHTPPTKKRPRSGKLTYTDRLPSESTIRETRRSTSKPQVEPPVREVRSVKGPAPSPPEAASAKDGKSSSEELITRTIGTLFVPSPVESQVNTKNKSVFADSFFKENDCEPVLDELNYDKTFQPPPLAYSEIFSSRPTKGVSYEKPETNPLVSNSHQPSLISNLFRFCYQGGSCYPAPSPLFTGMTGAAQVGITKKAPTLLYSGSMPDAIYKRSLSPQKNKVLQETGQVPNEFEMSTRTFNTMSRQQAPNPEKESEEPTAPKPEPLSDKPPIKPKRVYKDGFRETLANKQKKLSKAYENLVARNRLRAERKVSLPLNDKPTSKTKLNKLSTSANEMRSFEAEKTTGRKRRAMSILDKLNKSLPYLKESPNPECRSSRESSSRVRGVGPSGKMNLKAELQKKVLQLTRGKGRENWREDLVNAFFTEVKKPAAWNPTQEVRKKPPGTHLRGRPVESVTGKPVDPQEVGISYRAIRKKSGTTTPYTVRKSRTPKPPVPADLFKFAGPSTKVTAPARAKGKIPAKKQSYQRVFSPAESKMSKIKSLFANRATLEAERETRVKPKPFDMTITHKDIQIGPELPRPPMGLTKSKIEEEFSSRYTETLRPTKVEKKRVVPLPIKVTSDSKPPLKPKPVKPIIKELQKAARPAIETKPAMQAPGLRQKLSTSTTKDLQPQVYAKTSLLLKTTHLPLEPCKRASSKGGTPGGSFTSKLDSAMQKKAQEEEPPSRK